MNNSTVSTVYICHNGDGLFVPYNTQTFIPDPLKRLQNWVLWRIEERDGKATKVPYSPVYNGRASSTNPTSWGSYRGAGAILWNNPQYFKGLGFVLSLESGLVFIDIDDCIDDAGKLDDRATDIINTLGITFCEVSQSGRGLHLFVIGTIPKSFKNPNNGVEMYNVSRYCAITGNAIFAVDPVTNQEGLEEVYRKYKTPDKRLKRDPMTIRRNTVSSLDDREVIRKCMNNPKTGELFRRLYNGEYQMYASGNGKHAESGHHIADLVLCSLLAFWTDRDKYQIDRIFRTSGLVRTKWTDRDDYRTHTLDLACDHCEESVSEYIDRKMREESVEYEKCFLQE